MVPEIHIIIGDCFREYYDRVVNPIGDGSSGNILLRILYSYDDHHSQTPFKALKHNEDLKRYISTFEKVILCILRLSSRSRDELDEIRYPITDI